MKRKNFEDEESGDRKVTLQNIKTLEKIKSQVKIVKTKMAERHVTQPVKDVSFSI